MKKAVPFLLLFLLFAGAAWYSLTKTPEPVHEESPPQLAPATPSPEQQLPTQVDEDRAEPIAEPEPVETVKPLPALSESDPEVIQALDEIAGDEPVMEYMITDQIISRVVASIDSLTSRQVPVLINPVKPVSDKFIVDHDGEDLVLSPQNFARYDDYVSMLKDMDTDSMVSFYRRYYPLFQNAWEQNGGTGSFNDRLFEVMDNLMATPEVTGAIYLTKPEAVYLFEDPDLESLTAGQKVLVRMGNDNAMVVKEKLRAFRAEMSQ